MVVKSKVGRRRYIIAEKNEKIKEAMKDIREIDMQARVIGTFQGYTVIRCRHWYKDNVINILNEHGIKTYRTTGTIKSAKKHIEKFRA